MTATLKSDLFGYLKILAIIPLFGLFSMPGLCATGSEQAAFYTMPRAQSFVEFANAVGLYRLKKYGRAKQLIETSSTATHTRSVGLLYAFLLLKTGNDARARSVFKAQFADKNWNSVWEQSQTDASGATSLILEEIVNGNYLDAELIARIALSRETGDMIANRAGLLGYLALCLCAEERYSEAEEYMGELSTLIKNDSASSNDKKLLLYNQSLIAQNEGDMQGSYDLLKAASAIHSTTNTDNEQYVDYHVLLSLAQVAIMLDKDDEIESWLNQIEPLLDISKSGGNAKLRELYRQKLSLVEKKFNAFVPNMEQPSLLHSMSIHQSRAVNKTNTLQCDPSAAVPILQQLGWLHKSSDDFLNAQTYLTRAELLVDEKREPLKMAEIKYELAEIALFKSDFHAATALYETVVKLRRESEPNSNGLVWALQRLGSTYMAEARYEEAEAVLIEAVHCLVARFEKGDPSMRSTANGFRLGTLVLPDLSRSIDSENLNELALVLEPLCGAYCALNRYNEAKQIIDCVITIKESVGGTDSESAVASKCQLAYILQQDTKYGAAVKLYSYLLALPNIEPLVRADCFLSRALCFDLTGQFTLALDDMKHSAAIYKIYLKTNPGQDRIRWLCDDIEYQIKRKVKFRCEGPDYIAAVDKHAWDRRSLPLKIYIDDTKMHGFDALMSDKFKEAISQWLQSSDTGNGAEICSTLAKSDRAAQSERFFLPYQYVDNADDAQIVLARVGEFDELPSGAGGQTTYDYLVENQPASGVKKVTIRMFCTSRNSSELNEITKRKLYSLCLHEIGHALGLDGHSPNGLDIMYWKSGSLALTPRDRATLAKLYR